MSLDELTLIMCVACAYAAGAMRSAWCLPFIFFTVYFAVGLYGVLP